MVQPRHTNVQLNIRSVCQSSRPNGSSGRDRGNTMSEPKLLEILQSVLGKKAVGSPQVLVSMLDAPLVNAAGMYAESLDQNQTLM